ncbi:MAG: ATP-binding protein [Pseudomonadales bacterium]|nr:ATP-binding protein [Pseudomonadales bacterium]
MKTIVSKLSWLVCFYFLSGFLSPSIFASQQSDFLVFDVSQPRLIDPYVDDDIIPIKVGSRARYYNLGAYTKFYRDSSNSLSIEDVASEKFKNYFQGGLAEILNFGITRDTIWLKFQLEFPLQNLSIERKKKWILEMGRSQLDVAELYFTDSAGNLTKLSSDLRTPLSQRPYRSAMSVFPIELYAGQNQTFFLKVNSGNSIVGEFSIWSEIAYLEKTSREEYFFGAFFGAMLILVLYNFMMYLSVSDKSYLYYSIAFLGFSIFEFTEIGHGFAFLGDSAPQICKAIEFYSLWFTWLAVIAFTRSYFETATNYPAFDFVLRMAMVVQFAHIILSFGMDYVGTYIWLSFFSIFMMVLIAQISYVIWRQGNQSALYFLLSWMVGVAGGITYALVVLAVLPPEPLLILSAPVGILLGSLTLSFGLTDRIRRMRNLALKQNKLAVSNLTRYHSLFQNAVEGIYRMNLQGHLISANTAMAQILGFSSLDQLMQQKDKVLVLLKTDLPRIAEDLKGDFQSKKEYAIDTTQGRKCWVKHHMQLILNEDNKPSHIEGKLIDVSERIELERAESEREKQRVEKEMAAASAEAKSSFLANMSHEIRTPLTAILGYSELLSDPKLSIKDATDSLDTVIRSSYHLLDLIDDVLDFSKIEAQQMQVKQESVDLLVLLKEVESYFVLKAQEKGIYFKVEFQLPIPKVIYADGKRVKQILLNLCSNAVKFTQSGGVTLKVAWQSAAEKFEFSVVDTGLGLTETQIGLLFNAFTQAEDSTARQFGGTGLGLVISKQLAELMSGGITVTSEPGKGSCFTAVIGGGLEENTELLTDREQLHTESRDVDNEDVGLPSLSGKILVAEDNEENRNLLRILLSKTGADIKYVDNGYKAIQYIQANQVDLVVMDMHMPVMNGIDATKAIRKAGNNVPVVAISAAVLSEDMAVYEKAGVSRILAKPIDRVDFYQTLNFYMGDLTSQLTDDGASRA